MQDIGGEVLCGRFDMLVILVGSVVRITRDSISIHTPRFHEKGKQAGLP